MCKCVFKCVWGGVERGGCHREAHAATIGRAAIAAALEPQPDVVLREHRAHPQVAARTWQRTRVIAYSCNVDYP